MLGFVTDSHIYRPQEWALIRINQVVEGLRVKGKGILHPEHAEMPGDYSHFWKERNEPMLHVFQRESQAASEALDSLVSLRESKASSLKP